MIFIYSIFVPIDNLLSSKISNWYIKCVNQTQTTSIIVHTWKYIRSMCLVKLHVLKVANLFYFMYDIFVWLTKLIFTYNYYSHKSILVLWWWNIAAYVYTFSCMYVCKNFWGRQDFWMKNSFCGTCIANVNVSYNMFSGYVTTKFIPQSVSSMNIHQYIQE